MMMVVVVCDGKGTAKEFRDLTLNESVRVYMIAR